MHSSVVPTSGGGSVSVGGAVVGGVVGQAFFLGVGNILKQNTYFNYDDTNANLILGVETATSTVANLIGTTFGDSLTVAADGSISTGLARLNIASTATSPNARLRFSAATGGFNSLGAVGSTATLGRIDFAGWDGAALQNFSSIRSAVNGSVSAGTVPTDLIFSAGTTALTERMRILSSGLVGMGTTVPTVKLHVTDQGLAPSNKIGLFSTFGTTSFIQVSSNGEAGICATGIASSGAIMAVMTHNGTPAVPIATASGDILGSYAGGGYDGTGSVFSGQIQFICNGAVTTGNIPTEIAFFTGGSAAAEALRIDKTGNTRSKILGTGFCVAEGSNAKMGTAVLVGGTKVVSTTAVTANSRIFLTSNVDGGTPGSVRVSTRTAGTSFTITSLSAVDTSTIAWIIFEPS